MLPRRCARCKMREASRRHRAFASANIQSSVYGNIARRIDMKHIAMISFVLLSGCASMQWGEFDGQRKKMADPDVYDVIVVAVDGRADFGGRTNYRLQPGFHLLQVASSKQGNHGEVSVIPLPISVKPCTRYSFAAKHHSRIGIENWDLLSTGETLMPGCEEPAKNSGRHHALLDSAANRPRHSATSSGSSRIPRRSPLAPTGTAQ